LGKKFHNSLKFGRNFFLEQFKNKIILHFGKFVATKKCLTKDFFSPLSFYLFLDPGSEIRDPGWVKIRIRDKHSGSATLVLGDGKLFLAYAIT
jgi:hypothetical protein